MATLKVIARELRSKGRGTVPAFRAGHGWRFAFSIDQASGLAMFSAQLDPVGRDSDLSDWHNLGEMLAAIGAPPKTPSLGNTIEHDPDAVHKWMWYELEDGTKRPVNLGERALAPKVDDA